MADVFISYRKADRARAEALANALKIENLDVWWDTALETGQTFDQKIQSVLEQVKCVVVIWSKESVKSEWVRAESAVGRERGVLVPVMVDDVNIPVPFNLIHTADLVGWRGDRSHPGYMDVVKQVKALAGKSNVAPLKPPPNRQLRALWRTVAAVAVVAAIGASVWVFKPWEAFRPKDPVVEAKKEAEAKHEAALSRLAVYGVQPGDFDKMTGRHIARHVFIKTTYDQLKTQAATGDPAALALQCAVDYWNTEDGIPDFEGAQAICSKASDAGEPAGHYYYGLLLRDTADHLEDESERDVTYKASVSEFKAAADKGFGWAEVEYGWRLRDGEGIEKDSAEAETWFLKAQALGLPAADVALGRLYLSGEIPSPMEGDAAFALVRKAADAGDVAAQYYAAEKLIDGADFRPDYEAALRYYKAAAAADEGDPSWRSARMIESTEDLIKRGKAEPTPFH